MDFGEGPPPRMSTCMEALGDTIYVFGGEASAHSSVPVDAHLWRVDTSGEGPKWEKVAVEGSAPSARVAAASAAMSSNRMFIFGGSNTEDGKLDDLWEFDADKSAWSQVEKKGEFWPEARNYHQMIAAGSDLFVFGGCAKSGRINDLLRFDTKAGEWEQLAPAQKGAEGCPSGRGGASLAAVSPELLVVMFGYDGKQHGDIYGFDLNTKRWTPLQHTGAVPPARSVTPPRMVRPGLFFLFGGERDAGVRRLLHGGSDGEGDYFSDSYAAVFKDGGFEWGLAQAWQDGPKARGWFASAAAGGSFYVFGGQDANGVCADPMRWTLD